MKLLLTGASGLLGHEISAYPFSDIEVVGLSHADFEITDPESVKDAILKHKPDIVLNAAAIINVDKCEEDSKLCFAVNTLGVKNILDALVKAGKPVIFIQISSSEVFGRVHEGEYVIGGYTEKDEPIPFTNYQKSKKEAEDVVVDYRKQYPNIFKKYFIARAGWLYGKGRPTFVEGFLKQLQEVKEMSVISDQWRSPTWTKDFVKGLETLMQGNYESGTYHIVSEGKPGEATTMDVINEIKDFLGKDRVKASFKMVSRNDLFKIPRAPSNVLLNTKLPKMANWRESLREYLKLL